MSNFAVMDGYGSSPSSNSERGVIAVLFLVVVALIFGALSLSMQTGQIVERRIMTDQASDAAAFAFASRAAQGLNYIAANNLAIAGTSHMAGAIHLTADWGAIILTLANAKAICHRGGGLSFDINNVNGPYSWLRPISRLYFRAASGLTKLNAAIKTSFPYLGMVDAVEVGSANAPGALVIPFGAQAIPASKVTSGTFAEKLKEGLKQTLRSLVPDYKGLVRINSDETFCLAYRAGKEAHGGDNVYHKISEWADLGLDGHPLKPLQDILSGTGKIFDDLGLITSLVGTSVGFSGCGFGEEGEIKGGNSSVADGVIAGFLKKILVGPISGRSIKLDVGTSTGLALLSPIGQRAGELKDDLNRMFHSTCNSPHRGEWNTDELHEQGVPRIDTDPTMEKGVCVFPTADGKKRKYLRKGFGKNGTLNGYQKGTEIVANETNENKWVHIRDLELACYGTVLFGWETYSGIPCTKKNDDPENKEYVCPDAADSHPSVAKSDRDSQICPPTVFIDTDKHISQLPVYYPYGPSNGVHSGHNFVNLNRGESSFVAPVLKELTSEDPLTAPPPAFNRFVQAKTPRVPFGAKPPVVPPVLAPGSMELVFELVRCAADASRCPSRDGAGGYYENINGDKFYPNLDRLNWLCPIASIDTAEATVAFLLSFHDFDAKRWDGNFKAIQEWHNQRVAEYVKHMKCGEWKKYKEHAPKVPDDSSTIFDPADPPNALPSNNYCNTGAHYCWQKAMQQNKYPGKGELAKGGISFFLPGRNTAKTPTSRLEDSLKYGVMTINSLRFDRIGDIDGDGVDPLPACPEKLKVKATLDDGRTQVDVCDVQPIVGFINRSVMNSRGDRVNLDDSESVGIGDVNLATGGAARATKGALMSRLSFLSFAQSAVKYEEPVTGDAERPSEPASRAKNYQMFWPSWKPVPEPARVVSKMLPDVIAPLMED